LRPNGRKLTANIRVLLSPQIKKRAEKKAFSSTRYVSVIMMILVHFNTCGARRDAGAGPMPSYIDSGRHATRYDQQSQEKRKSK
jgi:hypothetical protein